MECIEIVEGHLLDSQETKVFRSNGLYPASCSTLLHVSLLFRSEHVHQFFLDEDIAKIEKLQQVHYTSLRIV